MLAWGKLPVRPPFPAACPATSFALLPFNQLCSHAKVLFTAHTLYPFSAQAARAGEDCDGYRPTSYYESQRRSLDGFMSQPVQVRRVQVCQLWWHTSAVAWGSRLGGSACTLPRRFG